MSSQPVSGESRHFQFVESLESRQMMAAGGSTFSLGLNTHNITRENFPAIVKAVRDSGTNSVRLWYGFNSYETKKVNTVVRWVSAFKFQGFDVTLSVVPENGLHGTPDQTTNFFTSLINIPGLTSYVDRWEIGNEPDFEHYWNGTIAEYVTDLLIPASKVLHSVGEKVMSAGPSWNPEDVKAMVDAGMLPYVDYVGYHPYRYTLTNLIDCIEKVKEYAQGKPLIATEWNVRGYEDDPNRANWANAMATMWPVIRDNFAIAYYYAATVSGTRAGAAGLLNADGSANDPFYSVYMSFKKTINKRGTPFGNDQGTGTGGGSGSGGSGSGSSGSGSSGSGSSGSGSSGSGSSGTGSGSGGSGTGSSTGSNGGSSSGTGGSNSGSGSSGSGSSGSGTSGSGTSGSGSSGSGSSGSGSNSGSGSGTSGSGGTGTGGSGTGGSTGSNGGTGTNGSGSSSGGGSTGGTGSSGNSGSSGSGSTGSGSSGSGSSGNGSIGNSGGSSSGGTGGSGSSGSGSSGSGSGGTNGNGSGSTPTVVRKPRVTGMHIIPTIGTASGVTLTPGTFTTVDVSQLGTRTLNMVVSTSGTVGSVQILFGKSRKVDSTQTYSMYGEKSGDAEGVEFRPGTYTVKVRAFTEDSANGAGTRFSIYHFKVIDSDALKRAAQRARIVANQAIIKQRLQNLIFGNAS